MARWPDRVTPGFHRFDGHGRTVAVGLQVADPLDLVVRATEGDAQHEGGDARVVGQQVERPALLVAVQAQLVTLLQRRPVAGQRAAQAIDESERLGLFREADLELLLAALEQQGIAVEDHEFRLRLQRALFEARRRLITQLAGGHHRLVEQGDVLGLDEARPAAFVSGKTLHQRIDVPGGVNMKRPRQQSQPWQHAGSLHVSRQKSKKLNQLQGAARQCCSRRPT
ncbi:MAG: hypothetical protein IPJ52_10445 [Rhodocyclaceae bacterium]|nr:hypothetical protein [Rhodocyclaceae bacterium]